MTIGRFQPMTVGHNNMIIEGDAPCIVYRINSSNKIPNNIKGWKVDGRVVKKEAIQHVINYLNDNGKGELTEQEKELLKRPFTNELIDKELQIVKKSNKNIIDVIPVVNMFDALMKFNKFITDHADEYEPQYLMCGDDRADAYKENIDKYDELDDDWNSGKKIPNILKGVLKVNTGKGRIEGVSGTAVRKAIITKDKVTFEKIMPKGVGSMFNDFANAFDEFKDKLQGLIKECKMMTLKEYIIERLNINESSGYYKTLSNFLETFWTEEDWYDDISGALDDNNKKTRLNLIDNGYCLTVCNCVSFLEDEPFYDDVEYYLLDDGGTSYHFFMKYDDLYYDAYNYKGVKKLSDLQFCKIYMKGKSDDYLNKYLILVGKGDDFTYEKAQSYIK